MSYDIRGYKLKVSDYCIATIDKRMRIGRVRKTPPGNRYHLHLEFLDGPDTVSFGPRSIPHVVLSLEPFLKGLVIDKTLGEPTEFKDMFDNTIHLGQTVVHPTHITLCGDRQRGWRTWYYLGMSSITKASTDFLWAEQISEHPVTTPEERSSPAPKRRKIKQCIALGPHLRDITLQARLKSI